MKIIKNNKSKKFKPLSHFALINKENISKDINEINYLDITNVKDGKINEIKLIKDRDLFPSRAKRVANIGDSIFSTVRPKLKGFALIKNDKLIVSTGFAVVSAKNKCFNRFLYYSLTTDDTISWMDNLSVGSSYPTFKASELLKREILDIQEDEAEKIGELLEKQENNIRLLEELLQKEKQRFEWLKQNLTNGNYKLTK